MYDQLEVSIFHITYEKWNSNRLWAAKPFSYCPNCQNVSTHRLSDCEKKKKFLFFVKKEKKIRCERRA